MFKLEQAGMMNPDETWLGTMLYAIRTELDQAVEYCKKFDYKHTGDSIEEVEFAVQQLKDAIDWAQTVKDEKEHVPEPEDDETDGQAGTP